MSNLPQAAKRRGRAAVVLGIVGGSIVLLVAGLIINDRIARRRFAARTPPPGQRFDVDGHQMHIHCTGSGSPTVVVDGGNACFSLEWTPIQEALQGTTRVCIYDRAGYGWSETGPSPRDGATVAAELHKLLEAAGEDGPFLLVGHSLGGMHVRLYAAEHPDQVAGLVLIDTAAGYTVSPEFQKETQSSIGFYQVMRLLTGSGLLRVLGPLGGENAMPETARKLPPELQDTYLNFVLDPRQHAAAIDEMAHLQDTLRQTGEVLQGEEPLGDRPVIVLTAGQRMAPGSTPFDERQVPVDEAIITAQASLTALSSRGEQRLIPESGHQVHLDAQDAVVAAIIDAIEMARQEE
jgi:pimeloyl-ACP methyl ester carboxylesterase